MLYMKQKIDRKIHSKRNHCYNLNKTYRLFSISIKRFSLLSLNLELPSPVFRDTRSI